MEENDSGPAEDIVRILVATDNHLGFMEKDPVRGADSFITFEEILKTAKEKKVDFVLLGGDLFHDNKPSRSTLYKTMELLRTYCLGDRPVNLEILSDQTLAFHNKFGCVNYEDPNFNIEIPIFSIHGNHDDPAGEGRLAALDILSVANLVNYFGKSDNIDDINVYPILMKKGNNRIALYGMGNIRDERLYRTFHQKKVKFMRPKENRDDWFNILVLHQNRVAHSPKNYVHESMLDSFLELVIWGHEHECLVTPQQSTISDYYITQPGSSVATALSEGEAKKKHIAILEIKNHEFRIIPIPLKTVRPFILDEVVLSSVPDLVDTQDSITEYLAEKVEEMIAEAEIDLKCNDNSLLPKPLIRLKVEYTGFSTINPSRFGQRYVGRVANPNDILLFYKKRTAPSTSSKNAKEQEQELLIKALRPDPVDAIRIEDLIDTFLSDAQSSLGILLESEFNRALQQFVEKDDKNAISDFVSKTLESTRSYLTSQDTKTVQPDEIQNLIVARTAEKRKETPIVNTKRDFLKKYIKDENDAVNANSRVEEKIEAYDDEEEATLEPPPKKSRSTPKKGKTTAASKKTESKPSINTKKQTKLSKFTALPVLNLVSDEEEEEEQSNSKTKKQATPLKSPIKLESKNGNDNSTPSTTPKKRRIGSLSDLIPGLEEEKPNNEDNTSMDGLNTANWGKRKRIN